jgi:hypothetical protein
LGFIPNGSSPATTWTWMPWSALLVFGAAGLFADTGFSPTEKSGLRCCGRWLPFLRQ